MKYTKEILSPIASRCFSIAEILRNLNLKQAGGTHYYISKKLKKLGIDTSHFLGKKGNHKSGKKLKWEKVLVLRETGQRQKAYILRRALIDAGVEYECSECSIDKWLGKKLILPVDHKNGNWLDDRKDNLRFLCPNCHSQSPKYCGSKGKTDIIKAEW